MEQDYADKPGYGIEWRLSASPFTTLGLKPGANFAVALPRTSGRGTNPRWGATGQKSRQSTPGFRVSDKGGIRSCSSD